MQLNQLQPTHQRKLTKRIGRGGKKGTYCGRGLKGQNSRAGHRKMPLIRQFIKRYPKLRGYKFKGFDNRIAIIDLALIEKRFDEKMIVSPATLVKAGLVRKIDCHIPSVKILGEGEVTKAFKVSGCIISKSAKAKIEKAGGKILKIKAKKVKKVKRIVKPVVKKAEPEVAKTKPAKVEKTEKVEKAEKASKPKASKPAAKK